MAEIGAAMIWSGQIWSDLTWCDQIITSEQILSKQMWSDQVRSLGSKLCLETASLISAGWARWSAPAEDRASQRTWSSLMAAWASDKIVSKGLVDGSNQPRSDMVRSHLCRKEWKQIYKLAWICWRLMWKCGNALACTEIIQFNTWTDQIWSDQTISLVIRSDQRWSDHNDVIRSDQSRSYTIQSNQNLSDQLQSDQVVSDWICPDRCKLIQMANRHLNDLHNAWPHAAVEQTICVLSEFEWAVLIGQERVSHTRLPGMILCQVPAMLYEPRGMLALFLHYFWMWIRQNLRILALTYKRHAKQTNRKKQRPPSAHPPVRVPVCPSVNPSVCPSARPSIRPSVRLSVCPSVRPSIRASVRLSIRPSVHLSESASVHLSARSPVCWAHSAHWTNLYPLGLFGQILQIWAHYARLDILGSIWTQLGPLGIWVLVGRGGAYIILYCNIL